MPSNTTQTNPLRCLRDVCFLRPLRGDEIAEMATERDDIEEDYRPDLEIEERLKEEPLDGLIDPTALDLLATQSGGVVRDVVRLLQMACRKAMRRGATRVKLDHANSAVAVLGRDYELALTDPKTACLKQAASNLTLPDDETALDLLYDNFIVCYSNHKLWYYPHACLLGVVGWPELPGQ